MARRRFTDDRISHAALVSVSHDRESIHRRAVKRREVAVRGDLISKHPSCARAQQDRFRAQRIGRGQDQPKRLVIAG